MEEHFQEFRELAADMREFQREVHAARVDHGAIFQHIVKLIEAMTSFEHEIGAGVRSMNERLGEWLAFANKSVALLKLILVTYLLTVAALVSMFIEIRWDAAGLSLGSHNARSDDTGR